MRKRTQAIRSPTADHNHAPQRLAVTGHLLQARDRLDAHPLLGTLLACACAALCAAGLLFLARAHAGLAWALAVALAALVRASGARLRLVGGEPAAPGSRQVPASTDVGPWRRAHSDPRPRTSAPRAKPPTPPRPIPEAGPDHPGLDLVTIVPEGPFWMGSDKALDANALYNELPRHQVTLSPYLINRVPVTRGLWRQVMAEAAEPWRRPVPRDWGSGGDDDLPATDVSWHDALAFCNALSLAAGRAPCYRQQGDDWGWIEGASDGYRLPTEAEWEHACRGGSPDPWYWGKHADGADAHAWFSGNSGNKPHPVGKKTPNALGLHDMAGNCWEWCWDRYAAYGADRQDNPRGPSEEGQRVLRGGSFVVEPRNLRSADRVRSEPGGRDRVIGFRCVRSAPPAP